ncbi:hypothetical protein [Limnobacter sp.]|uniref:hypothetical protein n=1 Tax=Limnobacter sp. TaxID=2003368 RepID=UPI0027B922DE|nr:hypothetical protein [Limnobacter sp.]
MTNTLGPIEFDERAKIKNRELCEILSSSVKNKDLPFGYPSISVEQISINETEPSLDYVIKTQASVPLFRADVEFFGEIFPLSSLLYGVTHFEGEQQWHERMLDLVIKRLEVTDVNSYMVTLGIANGLKSISEQNPFLESLFNQPEFFDSNVTDKEFIESSPEPVRKHDELAQLSSKVRSDVVETIVSTCQSGKVLYRFSPFLLGLVFLLSLIIMNSEGLVFIRDDATSTFSKFDPVLSIYAYQHWFDSSVFEVTGPWSFVIPEIKLWHILLPSIMVGVTSLTFLLRPYHRWRLKEINRFERIKHFVDQGLPRHQARDLVLPLCLVIAPILFTVFF